jgi:hypothetical protein
MVTDYSSLIVEAEQQTRLYPENAISVKSCPLKTARAEDFCTAFVPGPCF